MLRQLPETAPETRSTRFPTYLGHILLSAVALIFSYVVYDRFGMGFLMAALIALIGASIYAIISLKHLPVPFLVWLATIGGFRFLLFIRTPFLPDLSLDRLAMIWVGIIFLIKIIAERRPLRRPYTLDAVLLVHLCYLLWRIWINDMYAFHAWTMSYLVPYSAFFLSKNIIYERKWMTRLLVVLLVLSVYYDITSVAEKFHLNQLIWPKYILSDLGGGFEGRSRGPFLQAALFGTIIGMILPLYLYFAQRSKRLIQRGLCYAGLGLGCVALYFTYTRGSWLAGLFALLATAGIGFRKYLRPFTIFTSVAVMAGMLGLLGLGQDQFLKERMETEQTVASRFGTMGNVLRVWKDNALFGVGMYRYRLVKLEYYDIESVPIFGTVSRAVAESSVIHDIYWGVLAEDGLVGFSLQLLIYFLMYRAWRRKYRYRHYGDHFARDVLPLVAGLYFAYLVGGAVIDYRYFSFVGALFYTFAGIVDGYDPRSDPVTARNLELAGV
jgi:hypothetical protein